MRTTEPHLQQRPGCRQNQERKSHAHGQYRNHSPLWRRPCGNRLPDCSRRNRGRPRLCHHGQHCQRGQQKHEMHPRLRPHWQSCRNHVRVEVSQQQEDLEKQQASVPNRWASPKPRQHVFSNNQLHLKQQKRAQENRAAIQSRKRQKFGSRLYTGDCNFFSSRGGQHPSMLAESSFNSRRFHFAVSQTGTPRNHPPLRLLGNLRATP